MSAGAAVPIEEASAVAERLVSYLAPSCERIEIAGSIRRRKPVVHDIEIVASPRWGVYDVADLWGASASSARSPADVCCTSASPCRRPRADFFRELGQPWVDPWDRHVDRVAIDWPTTRGPS